MWFRRILGTPAGALFLFEARRHWAGKQLKLTWGLVLFTVLHLCAVAAGWIVLWNWAAGVCRRHLIQAYAACGVPLYAWWVLLQFSVLGMPLELLTLRIWTYGGTPWLIRGSVATSLLLPVLASRILLPAYAARAFAPGWSNGRLRDVALLPLGPGRAFLAVGLGALLPFAALQLLSIPVALAGYAATLGQKVPLAFPGATFQPHPYLVGLAGITLTPIRVAFDAVLLLCISAICRHARKAMFLCYLVGLFGTWSIDWVITLLPDGQLDPTRAMTATFVTIAVEALALAVLLPRAFAALRYPDE